LLLLDRRLRRSEETIRALYRSGDRTAPKEPRPVNQVCDPHLFVIFGATGDLMKRKLLPALYRVITENRVSSQIHFLGVARHAMTEPEFRQMAEDALAAAGHFGPEVQAWCRRSMFFQPVHGDPSDFVTLASRIASLESEHDLPGNRAFYLALPPRVVPDVVAQIGAAGLNGSPGWTRIVVEKPIGRDLQSAQALNEQIHRHFEESQIYRIDHYLGKETVQNLLTFRFANPIFETTWNRDRIQAVEITVAEDLGVGTRADYYDHAGALRDMVQSHLSQLLTLVAMEPPSKFSAESIRNEKVQVLQSIAGIDPGHVVFGQYAAGRINGEDVAGYLDEPGVAAGSTTPTFAGVRIEIPNYRWQGVPFFLRTGKRLPRRTTQVALTYKRAPVCVFHGIADDCPLSPNVILLTLQPDEGFEVRFELKAPGDPPRIVSKPLYFDYEAEFAVVPDAYQTLLYDVMIGDQTLFVRADEVEESWRIYTPLLTADIHVHPYPAGTWGPAATNDALALWTDEWTMRT
jgi:glucose-6-phosphate 1-dehydrogenase